MVIHAAAEASARLNREQPFEMFSTIVDGARRALEFARARGSRRLLLTSSGAVYGKQPPGLSHIPEDYPGGPDPLDAAAAYAEGKRAAELLGRLACKPGQLDVKVARCFAFVGPYLPLDIHFAAGNFIRDGLRGGPISIGGDGTPYRSYLYAADLAIWLWRILWDGAPARAYNVGSEDALSIRELANQVAGCFDPAPAVQIARQPQPGVPAERYVPQTARAQQELGLRQWVDLADGLRRTIRWHQTISPVSAGTPHS